MAPNIKSLSSDVHNIRHDVFPLDQWTVSTKKGIIMQSKCTCSNDTVQTSSGEDQRPAHKDINSKLCPMCTYSSQLTNLNNMPDMLFHNNLLRIEHYSGLAVEFNPLDALKGVRATQDPLRVAVAEGWQSAKANFPFAKSVFKPFDWTFTTNYKGTLISATRKPKFKPAMGTSSTETTFSDDREHQEQEQISFVVEKTDERIDVNKLKVREEILFYEDITLFEDELADHGTAQYSVKVRVMPKSFYILARYNLRIDGVLARVNDTRIYHDLNKRYLLREYTNREAKLDCLDLPLSTVIEPNELVNHLPLMEFSYEKLTIPRTR